MVFTEPISFKQAMESRAVKAALPNDLSSRQLLQMDAELGERANVIARATNSVFIDKVSEGIQGLLTPRTAAGRGQAISKAEVRLELKRMLQQLGYTPPEGRGGTIEDLGSDQRLNLIIETQLHMATGYGYWERGMSRAALWKWPAFEFKRVATRKEPRDWPTRWEANGGQFYGPGGSYPEGRMIALKSDSIWTDLSVFGIPYPPFDFNSGMGQVDVDRSTCERLGLIRRDQAVAPQTRSFAADSAKMNVGQMTPALRKALLESLGHGYEIKDGVLQAVNEITHFQGLTINIENPKGSTRSGIDKDGTPWSAVLAADYGEIVNTEGADGDPVDVFIGPYSGSDSVFIIDQYDLATGNFDEHKCVLGFHTKVDALNSYCKSFSDGLAADRARHVTEMTMDQFRQWFTDPRKTLHGTTERTVAA